VSRLGSVQSELDVGASTGSRGEVLGEGAVVDGELRAASRALGAERSAWPRTRRGRGGLWWRRRWRCRRRRALGCRARDEGATRVVGARARRVAATACRRRRRGAMGHEHGAGVARRWGTTERTRARRAAAEVREKSDGDGGLEEEEKSDGSGSYTRRGLGFPSRTVDGLGVRTLVHASSIRKQGRWGADVEVGRGSPLQGQAAAAGCWGAGAASA
jgi:hypothetical protein